MSTFQQKCRPFLVFSGQTLNIPLNALLSVFLKQPWKCANWSSQGPLSHLLSTWALISLFLPCWRRGHLGGSSEVTLMYKNKGCNGDVFRDGCRGFHSIGQRWFLFFFLPERQFQDRQSLILNSDSCFIFYNNHLLKRSLRIKNDLKNENKQHQRLLKGHKHIIDKMHGGERLLGTGQEENQRTSGGREVCSNEHYSTVNRNSGRKSRQFIHQHKLDNLFFAYQSLTWKI